MRLRGLTATLLLIPPQRGISVGSGVGELSANDLSGVTHVPGLMCTRFVPSWS